MAYVVTLANGDRKFEDFTRFACADERLRTGDLQESMFKQASFFHFGSISQINSPSKEATAEAVAFAAKHDVLISYDPNVRIQFWTGAAPCKATILDTLPSADIVKINEDELFFLTGTRDLAAAKELREKHNVALLMVTLDSRGSHFFHGKGERLVPGFNIELIESTGAGDGFNAGLLSGLLENVKEPGEKRKGWRRKALESLSVEQIASVVYRANAVGALTCTKLGAIPALPTTLAVDRFLEQITSSVGAL
jgi:sugar/nucleoside kinase (ribokinase family)